jgi:flavin-binding protein dodecin
MKYEGLTPISKEAVEAALTSTVTATTEALMRAALTIDDRRWVESVLIEALSDSRIEVRRAALLSFGHLARVHHEISLGTVVPLLQSYATDPILGGTASDALEDIAMFVQSKALES